ncbi:hypothetical protein [Frigidibacter mobilis]|uniref:Uncharacterized protein n=1 Tax=Frigidibacter mobilis TaxID=1335048 RepID=A0A165SIZ5_9RHOB|nr:hypothetical protein [Frigidibacter mobilis]AMY68533.1 hypothetical protein AKL17_1277 [Frigidibacter mobilis]
MPPSPHVPVARTETRRTGGAPLEAVAALGVAHRDLPLDALAQRVADELDTLAQLSAGVQTALSLCHFAEHTDADAIRGLQGIDRITQSLEDLGRLMAAVSCEMPENVRLHAVPILSRLRLHELVANLDPDAAPVVRQLDLEGDIMWF